MDKKIRIVKSEDVAGSYAKALEVEHHDAYGTGFVRFEARCPGYDVGNASFNLSVRGAKLLRDALVSLFPRRVAPGSISKIDTLAPHGIQEYKGNGKHIWESVGGDGLNVRRLRVPGGWLYRAGLTANTTFVPMPDVVGYKI